MANLSPEKSLDADSTEVRFGTRAMLLTMAAVAVCAAVLGAFVRHFPEEARFRLAVYWAVLVVAMAGVVCYNARRRFVAEKMAGRSLFCLAPHSYFLRRAPRVAGILFGTFLLALAPTTWFPRSFFIAEPSANYSSQFNWWDFYAIAISASGISYYWWNRRVRVGEHGVVVRNQFLPWTHLRRWYWDACNKGVAVMHFAKVRGAASHGTAARVLENDRAAFAALLETKRAEANEIESAASGEA